MEQIDKKEVYDLKKELDIYNDYKDKFFKKIKILKISKDETELKKLLGNKTEEEWIKYYDDYITNIQNKIREQEIKPISEENSFILKKNVKKKFLEDINCDPFILRKITRKKEIHKANEIAYTIYSSSKYGSAANQFVENLTVYLTVKYPKFFNEIMHLLVLGDVKILSKTYVSMGIFSGFLASFLSFLFYNLFVFISGGDLVLGLIKSIPIGFLVLLIVPTLFYFYPYTLISNRKKAIKNDLPFVIIHMSAIAGSGASPISIFNLILNSGEYKGLEIEIKKIVNYVNLFGYDLSTALKAVSLTTPSPEFKDLLTGIIAATESGGDLRSYLKGKASDALTTYRSERKKYVESLATYSDLYTGILIAAPLLFMTTLAIINVIGGSIGSVGIKPIAMVGTFFVIPILNLIFLVFLNLTQVET